MIVTTLTAGFIPASWEFYQPTLIDVLTLVGSFGLFLTLFLLFVRYLPIVAIAEVKTVLPQAHGEHERITAWSPPKLQRAVLYRREFNVDFKGG